MILFNNFIPGLIFMLKSQSIIEVVFSPFPEVPIYFPPPRYEQKFLFSCIFLRWTSIPFCFKVWAEMKISDILPEEKDLLHEMSQQDWELFSQKTKLKPF